MVPRYPYHGTDTYHGTCTYTHHGTYVPAYYVQGGSVDDDDQAHATGTRNVFAVAQPGGPAGVALNRLALNLLTLNLLALNRLLLPNLLAGAVAGAVVAAAVAAAAAAATTVRCSAAPPSSRWNTTRSPTRWATGYSNRRQQASTLHGFEHNSLHLGSSGSSGPQSWSRVRHADLVVWHVLWLCVTKQPRPVTRPHKATRPFRAVASDEPVGQSAARHT
jgi:hypothetical protein